MPGAVWEFPGSCVVTRMECVGKPQRAGLKPSQIPKGEGRLSNSEIGWECVPPFPSRTWFSESGRGSDGPVCPSFLKRVMTVEVVSGLGTRKQVPEPHLTRRRISSDLCGKPTSMIQGVSEPHCPKCLPAVPPWLRAQIEPGSSLRSHRGACTVSTRGPHFWGPTCGRDSRAVSTAKWEPEEDVCKFPAPRSV